MDGCVPSAVGGANSVDGLDAASIGGAGCETRDGATGGGSGHRAHRAADGASCGRAGHTEQLVAGGGHRSAGCPRHGHLRGCGRA